MHNFKVAALDKLVQSIRFDVHEFCVCRKPCLFGANGRRETGDTSHPSRRPSGRLLSSPPIFPKFAPLEMPRFSQTQGLALLSRAPKSLALSPCYTSNHARCAAPNQSRVHFICIESILSIGDCLCQSEFGVGLLQKYKRSINQKENDPTSTSREESASLIHVSFLRKISHGSAPPSSGPGDQRKLHLI
jgi:hypothetical protein